MAVIKATHSKAKLSVAVDYVTQEQKTEEWLTSGIHCDPMSAVTEMETTKRLWRKTGGRQYDHYIQSFAPAEPVTPEQAHRIATQWAEQQFQGYECLIATHIDRDHVHSHIIVNSVSYETGKKLHTSAKWLQEAKDYSDKLCRQKGLSICVKNQTYEGKERTDTTTWNKNKHQIFEKAARGEARSFILDIAVAVCMVLKTALNREDFMEKLLEYGIATSWTDKQKYITFTDLEGNKVRNKRLTNTFHYDFSKESLEYQFEKRSQKLAERENNSREEIQQHEENQTILTDTKSNTPEKKTETFQSNSAKEHLPHEFTHRSREAATGKFSAAASENRRIPDRVQKLDVKRYHDTDRPAGQAPLHDAGAAEQPFSLAERLQRAKQAVTEQTGRKPEEYFSFDDLLSEGIQLSQQSSQQSRKPPHRGLER